MPLLTRLETAAYEGGLGNLSSPSHQSVTGKERTPERQVGADKRISSKTELAKQ